MDSASFFVGTLLGFAVTIMIVYVSDAFVSRNTLVLNGYRVVEHRETHGEFSTNWIEVVRTDGRPL